MLYISGIHALNLPCSLLTCGDWHMSALRWDRISLKESSGSFYGDYGIELGKLIPEHDERFNVANHIRALLDILQEQKFTVAQGMNKDFICNDIYTQEIFDLVYQMKIMPEWAGIDSFMRREYRTKWLDYKEGKYA